MFSPKIGEMIPNLTIIFSDGLKLNHKVVMNHDLPWLRRFFFLGGGDVPLSPSKTWKKTPGFARVGATNKTQRVFQEWCFLQNRFCFGVWSPLPNNSMALIQGVGRPLFKECGAFIRATTSGVDTKMWALLGSHGANLRFCVHQMIWYWYGENHHVMFCAICIYDK